MDDFFYAEGEDICGAFIYLESDDLEYHNSYLENVDKSIPSEYLKAFLAYCKDILKDQDGGHLDIFDEDEKFIMDIEV